jgi:hypothetical protein
MVEGEPLVFLADEDTDYPLIVLQPHDTEAEDAQSLIKLEMPVDIHLALKASSAGPTGVAKTVYKTARLIGEAVVAEVMDAGASMGGTSWLQRRLISCGVDYETTEQYADHGLLIYKARFGFRYFNEEVKP